MCAPTDEVSPKALKALTEHFLEVRRVAKWRCTVIELQWSPTFTHKFQYRGMVCCAFNGAILTTMRFNMIQYVLMYWSCQQKED